MKRTERHHLKENEFANLAASARQMVEEKSSQVLTISASVLAIIVLVGGYFVWRSSVESRADSALAEAMAIDDARVGPPAAPGTPSTGPSYATAREKAQAQLTKFKVVADEYPSTDAGAFARYREAATWLALGSPKEAVAGFQQVIDHSGNDLYVQMARLGLAEAQAGSGQYDSAISTFSDLAQKKDGPLPVDGILMQLARTYRDAGKKSEAEQTFNRVIAEFPASPYSDEARRELDTIKRG
ncbi:MAG TPA: tetratricopeptide repeat protein [Vicinamibacterales bacterium]|jgi:TolA-binding protein|nr:tetratricopeptide repeat protein [Vicinamibacterales bacterium]